MALLVCGPPVRLGQLPSHVEDRHRLTGRKAPGQFGCADQHVITASGHATQGAIYADHMVSVDLNADLGESFGTWKLGDDDAMLGLVTSANVACGFHAGDPATLSHSCREAARRGVRIGAQVGYRDLAGFGRRFIDVTPEDLRADVIYQIGALQGLAAAAGSNVCYVKPHGA